MPEIQGSDVARKLMLRYGLVGASPSPFLSPELVPVVVVDDLTGFDLQDPTFERPYTVSIQQVGGVGLRARIFLVNPVGSGVLLTLNTISGNANAATMVEVFTGPAQTVATAGFSTDFRLAARGVCGVIGNTTGIAPISPEFFFRLGPATESPQLNEFLRIPVVISPGTSLDFNEALVNDVMRLQFRWTERFLLPGEL